VRVFVNIQCNLGIHSLLLENIAILRSMASISQGAQLGAHSQKDQDSIAGSDRGLSLRYITQSNFRIHLHGVAVSGKALHTPSCNIRFHGTVVMNALNFTFVRVSFCFRFCPFFSLFLKLNNLRNWLGYYFALDQVFFSFFIAQQPISGLDRNIVELSRSHRIRKTR